jgi:pimeloyl-ACP methyl ester carboxylesterase
MSVLLALTVSAAAAVSERPIHAPGPEARLAGTLLEAGEGSPVVLVVPGSGPTDRDGNNPLGVAAASYRLLAEGLARKGISSVRIDKRGMFGSKAAIADANKVTIADYATDLHNWIKSVRSETAARCIWIAGHSEGALVALTAAQRPDGICGVITVAGTGRKLGAVMRDQLKSNPANAPILDAALSALDTLEEGKTVDATTLPAPLQPLFNSAVQPFLIDILARDPAKLAASLRVPLLVIQGDNDIQVGVDDAKLLAAVQPKARLAIMRGVNHLLKVPALSDRSSNLASYGDPSLPIAPEVVEEIAKFVKH